jgi:hypothetical protein
MHGQQCRRSKRRYDVQPESPCQTKQQDDVQRVEQDAV